MAHQFAQTMFTEEAKRLQQQHGSRAQYQRLAERGLSHDELGPDEIDFIARRDSFYLASVTSDGWPYVQHRGGSPGFLQVLDGKHLAFADFAGNKQYISTGNLVTDDRIALILMDYPNQTRLKLIGHARAVAPGQDTVLEQQLRTDTYAARIERYITIDLVAFDWNCPQHITPRYTLQELAALDRAS